MSRQSSRGGAWDKLRDRILERDGYVCQFCGANLRRSRGGDGAPPTVDHLLAKDKGGTDDASNLVAACLSCNSRKGNRSLTRTRWHNPRWLTHI